MPIDFTGAAVRLQDPDLPRIGYEIGVGEDVIHAIIDVEAPKSGFDDEGRPRILFEPHVFFRNLTGAKQQRAVEAGLAYRSWKTGAYGAESAQYGKLLRAIAIDETAALKACSWGRSQVLGENHLAAGYATVQDMVTDFCEDEDNHIEAMVLFLKVKKLDVHLRRIDKLKAPSTALDWAPVAAGYNGAGYATNGYHIKLAERHNWWRKRADTPWSPAGAGNAPAPVTMPIAPVVPLPPDVELIIPTSPEPKSRPGFWASFFAIFATKLQGKA